MFSRVLEVATTRPENHVGDTAVARLTQMMTVIKASLMGQMKILPIPEATSIVGDEHADPEFGTGVVKITPAHTHHILLKGVNVIRNNYETMMVP